MDRKKLLLIGLVLLTFAGWVGAQNLYAFFYSRSAGQDLEINLINLTATASQYTLTVYDAWGDELWAAQGELAPYDATFHPLGRVVPEGDTNWGLGLVVSEQPLLIGLEYSIDGKLHSVDIVDTPLPAIPAGTSTMLGAYYTQVGESISSVVVMNPGGQEVLGKLTVFKSDGTPLQEVDFTLAPYESSAYNMAQLVGQGSRNWGLVRVAVQDGYVVLACKYLKDQVLQVKNVSGIYSLTVAEPQGAPATPAQKED